MSARREPKAPTWTHLVTEQLRVADDFMSAQQLRASTGANANQLSAALHHLQVCRVVDAVRGPDGLHWFYCGRDADTRTREVDERRVEDRPRKARRARRAP